jgi:hypothetical protein
VFWGGERSGEETWRKSDFKCGKTGEGRKDFFEGERGKKEKNLRWDQGLSGEKGKSFSGNEEKIGDFSGFGDLRRV